MYITRYFKTPNVSYFLFGPRGTGKTTFLNHYYPDAIRVNLLEPDIFRKFSAAPERLREVIDASPNIHTVIIDEVQRLPEILGLVHSIIEEKRGIKFILTGSSSRKLKRSGVDLLAGRVVKKNLHPFIAAELGVNFNIEDAIMKGLIPLVFNSADPEDVLKTYIALYIREEVQAEGLIRNIGNFSRFLEAVSFSHASLLNISSVARECSIERKVVEGYISILEDLHLAYRINVFTKHAKRKISVHPKFYFFDAGVFRSLRPSGPLDKPEEINGAALEGLVAQHLVAWNSYTGENNNIFFWRTQSGSEIDFVVYGQNTFMAIEVKNTSVIRNEDLRSLKTFKEDYPQSNAYFLYMGKERLMKGNILCIPCKEFLSGIMQDRMNEINIS